MRDAHWATGIFLLLWLLGWTVGCGFLIRAVITQREPFVILFAIPFWISWIFIAVWLTNIFFGRHRFILGPEGLVHERHVLFPLSRRQVPLPEIRRFQVRVLNVDSEGSATTGIEAVTLGRSLTFGTHLSALERTWLAHRLDEHRRQLHRQAGVTDPGDGDLTDCRACCMPADCAWGVSEEYPSLTFQQRGRFRPGPILVLVFINGFWNGIVGVFVGLLFGYAPGDSMPAGIAWWGLFLFLLPFEAIGLGMLLALLLALLEPFRLTRWIITSDAIEQATTRLSLPLGWRCWYPYDTLGEATIRDDLGSWGRFALNSKPTLPTGEQYGLLLTNTDHREICSIKRLTLGEARWMKGRLQENGYLR